ncbi:MAG: hypothetical protein BHV63_04975 [Alistipes sp. 56_11]|nr:MAG: hypothetical protein BHV63_04975 [Alistipes sp. 56_11]
MTLCHAADALSDRDDTLVVACPPQADAGFGRRVAFYGRMFGTGMRWQAGRRAVARAGTLFAAYGAITDISNIKIVSL